MQENFGEGTGIRRRAPVVFILRESFCQTDDLFVYAIEVQSGLTLHVVTGGGLVGRLRRLCGLRGPGGCLGHRGCCEKRESQDRDSETFHFALLCSLAHTFCVLVSLTDSCAGEPAFAPGLG